MYKFFMKFTNPTDNFCGEHRSVQGFTVHENLGFVLFHTGICAVYDLTMKNEDPIDVFRLGSYNGGNPDSRYINHANDAMFGPKLPGDEFPLMYVTAGNSGDSDVHGYIAYCAVERLYRHEGHFHAETVQRIYYKNDGIESTSYQCPGWGWPASLVDHENGWFYLFSARYRTKKEFSRPDNVYIVTKFCLPSPDAGDVTLTPHDIVEQFVLPFRAYITQGGTIKNGILWYTFGFGTEEYPDALLAIDLSAKKYLIEENLADTPFANHEIECCGFLGDRLLINTQNEEIYERTVSAAEEEK